MTATRSASRATLLPTTRVGRWAGWFLASSLLLLAVVVVGFNTGIFGTAFAEETAGRYALAGVFAASVLGLLVTAGWAWLKRRDHSVVVIAAGIAGVLLAAIVVFGSMPG